MRERGQSCRSRGLRGALRTQKTGRGPRRAGRTAERETARKRILPAGLFPPRPGTDPPRPAGVHDGLSRASRRDLSGPRFPVGRRGPFSVVGGVEHGAAERGSRAPVLPSSRPLLIGDGVEPVPLGTQYLPDCCPRREHLVDHHSGNT